MLINKQMDNVIELNQSGEKEAAWALVKRLMDKYPDESELWSLQGYLYADNGIYDKAISSLDKAIAMSPEQATFYFHRGCYNIHLGNVLEAASDLSAAIAKDKYSDNSFTETLYFYRAEAFIELGKKQEALSDLSHISDNFETWTSSLRTKADLLSDCENL